MKLVIVAENEIPLLNLCTLGKIDKYYQRDESFVKRLIELEGKIIGVGFCGCYCKQERYAYIGNCISFDYANGVIIAIDLTNSRTLETAAFWKSEIDKKFPLKNIPILLVGDKGELKSRRAITYDEAKMFSDELGILYIEVSTLTGKNVNKAFEVLLRYGLTILLKLKS